MRQVVVALFVAFAAVLEAVSVRAMTITESVEAIPGLAPSTSMTLNTIRMTGLIEPGDAARLRDVLVKLKAVATAGGGRSRTTVAFSSNGGDVREAIAIGYLLHDFDVATLVQKGDACLSACALAFLGGTASHGSPFDVAPKRNIERGGRLAFHSFSLNYRGLQDEVGDDQASAATAGFDLARAGSSLVIKYCADMGIEPAFVARILGSPVDQFEYIETAGQFRALGACLTEPVKPMSSPERQAVNICNSSAHWPSRAEPSQARRLTSAEARLHLLRHIERNVSSMGAGRFADELSAVIASKDPDMVKGLYTDLRAAGLPLPDLVGAVFEVTGYSAGIYQLACVVSLSLDDADKFDFVLEGPAGTVPSSSSATKGCAWLRRHDPDDVINPRSAATSF